MTVLDVNNVCKRFDIELLLDGVSFKLNRGEKVGLIGGNGCGKTTLLKMIAGIEDPSSGVITRPGGSRVGYLAQEPAYDGRTVSEELLEEGLEWLEGFLGAYEKTVLLVSHNRCLLDRVVGRILEIENGRVAEYKGNYSAYRVEKLRESLKQKTAFDDQQKEIRRLEAMIKRFALWAKMTEDIRHARQARSRQKMLDRMERIGRPNIEGDRIQPHLGAAERAGNIALELRGYSRAFGEKVLFDAVDLHLSSKNGSGCSVPTVRRNRRFSATSSNASPGKIPSSGSDCGSRSSYSQEHETLNPSKFAGRGDQGPESTCRAGSAG